MNTTTRTRKPYRVVRVRDAQAPHGVDARLVLEVHPNGLVVIREHGRRVRHSTTVAAIYVAAIRRAVSARRRK